MFFIAEEDLFISVKFLKAWTLLVITQNNCWHKKLLGNEQWGALKKRSFMRRGNLSLKYYKNSGLQSFIRYLCNKGVFLSFFSCNLDDKLSPNFHRFVAYVGIHQVRILVFENYWSLKKNDDI